MSKLLISDTADAVITRKSDGKVAIYAETQLASIAATLGINEKIFGSIGNKPLAIMRGQKEITSTIRNAFYDTDFLAMSQGVTVQEDGTAEVHKREDGLKVSANETDSTLEVTITGTPVGSTVTLRNAAGETEEATVATQTVTVPEGFAVEGDLVSVTYKSSITGDVIELDAEKFSEAHELELHTIGYDPDTNQVVKDIYIQLDHVLPSGDFELSLENGTAIAPEINFEALAAPNSTQIGRVIEEDRV